MLNSIQALRALAAWIVFFHHYMQIAYGFQVSNPVAVALRTYGAIGVDLFFVISGFVIYLAASRKSVSPLIFALHRVVRVAPAYWMFTLLSALVLVYMPGMIPFTLFEPLFMLKSLLFIPSPNPTGIGFYPLMTVGWTLNFEMAFYAMFTLTLLFPKIFRVTLLALGIVILSEILPFLGGNFLFYENPIIYEFLFGVGIAIAYKKGWVLLVTPAAGLLVGLLGVALVFYLGDVNHNPRTSGLACSLIVIGALANERLCLNQKFLARLGDWSYSTYLCHVLVISLSVKLQGELGLNPIVACLGSVMVTLVLSMICYTFVEMPLASYGKTTFGKKSKPSSDVQPYDR